MDRKVFDALAAHHGLTPEGVERMLEIGRARPNRLDVEHFVVRVLHLAGVLSIAAGVVFLVAANWSTLPVLGRFALVEGVLVGALAIALWRPAPHAPGRYALLLAFIVTGALFALYGQTYQTGADVHELFLNWALLGVVFAVAAQWSVVWAAWVLVLNVALWLFCGARPEAGLLWAVFSSWSLSTSQLLLIPLVVNAALWGLSCILPARWSAAAPQWLGRFALACGVASGTWAGLIVVIDGAGGGEGSAGLIVSLALFAAIGLYALRRRDDVFPLAAIEGSLIVLSTAWIVRASGFDGTGMLFVVAMWLILASTVSGHALMRLVRAWAVEEGEA